MTLHPRVGKWLQLGGHCEDGDITVAGAALREAIEESGIPDLRVHPQPLHLAVHPITCSLGVPTRHFDIRYRVTAGEHALPVLSGESEALRWWPVDALPEDCEDELRAAVRLAR